MLVLLDPARSAEPPISHGTRFAMAFSALPDAARVAIGFSSFGVLTYYAIANASA